MKFLDLAKIHVQSGNGGHGCLSFRREKFLEFGGPDGGDGGRGGDVVAVAVAGLNTLVDFRYRPHVKARNGRPGEGANRTGADAETVLVQVPAGTEVLDEERETVLADLTEVGQRAILAKGGDGGRGNAAFKSSTNRAPRRVEPGWPGQEFTLWLRLKLIADVGIIGLPNAGKSTLLARVSRARPKIADYPFTTLHPNLGVVRLGETSFVMADVPGLIAGAHEGAGLGDRFLGHIERCGALLHLVDGTAEDPAAAWRTVRAELEAYGAELAAKPEVLALSKVDALDQGTAAERRGALEAAAGRPVLAVSAVSGAGLEALLARLAALVASSRAAEEAEAPAQAWQPR
jgi:GTPase